MSGRSPTAGQRLLGLGRLFRFELPLAAGLCVVLGQFLAVGGTPAPRIIALGFLAIFCISATALILNDYLDLETDRINAPHRPIPSGEVRPRDALVLSLVVALAGLLASAALGRAALVTAAIIWVIGVLYNGRFKRTGFAGNLMVAASVGMTFIFGGITVGRPASIHAWWFGAIAFLMDLGEEIAADAMDAEGDKLIGSASLAILYGRTFALRVSAVIFGVLVVVSLVPFLLGLVPKVYLLPILTMDAVTLYAAIRLLDARLANPRAHFMRKSLLPVLGAIVLFGSSCHSAARPTTKAAPAMVKAAAPVIVWQPSHQTDTGADFNEAAVSNGIAEAAMKTPPLMNESKVWSYGVQGVHHANTGSNTMIEHTSGVVDGQISGYAYELQQANKLTPGVFIAIHNNGGTSRHAVWGYIHDGDTFEAENRALAARLVGAIAAATDLENRGVLLDSSTGRNNYRCGSTGRLGFYSLDEHVNSAPYRVLLEIGDNGVSRAFLQDPAKQQILGEAIKKELAAWLADGWRP